MAFTRAWRNFKRMQDLTVAAASLIYAGAAVHAFGRLPGGRAWCCAGRCCGRPSSWCASLVIPLLIVAPLKRWLTRYVWMSFQAGFGQTPGSIMVGVALLLGAALFIYWQMAAVAATGPLSGQRLLRLRRRHRHPGRPGGPGPGAGAPPEVRQLIEEP